MYEIRSLTIQHTVDPEHLVIFKNLMGQRSLGSATDTLFEKNYFFSQQFYKFNFLARYCKCKTPFPSVLYTFDSVKVFYLRICYGSFIPHVNILEVPQICWKYKTAKWWSQYLKSSEYPAKISTCILAHWVGADGQITED